jgi:hypothetical protein
MRRIFLLACAAGLPVLAGCVEGEQTFTINPDGSGKARFDVVMAPPFELLADGGDKKKAEDKTVAELRLESLKVLLETKGVDAWKDVTTEFAPDGRLKFSGTAYFKKLDDVEFKNIPFLGPGHALTGKPAGPLTLGKKPAKKDGGGGPNLDLNPVAGGKTPEQLAKMTDAELDEYILKQRIEYQKFKPMLRMIMADAKVKTTYVLPGEPDKVVGFKREGPNSVSFVLDGNKILGAFDKVMTMDNKELRKILRAGGEAAVLKEFAELDLEAATATVAKPGKPQFDYAAEVKAAKNAYPQLRKKLRLPKEIPLPGETDSDRPDK